MALATVQPQALVTPAVSVRSDPRRGDPVYSEFYKHGGWKYSFWKEYWWHRKNFVKRFKLRRGMRILEVACGNGFHTNLLNRMGFACTGVDRSREGIEWAKGHYPKSTYYCADIDDDLPVSRRSFDAVYARGCSHYHYDLMSAQAVSTTTNLLRYLGEGGVFIMAIVTNLSGRREPDKIWHNTLDDYRRHFSSFGEQWSVDWIDGMAVCGLWNSARSDL